VEENNMVVAQRRGRKQKIIVALSGGVDSAVAAQLLKEEGHEVIGVYLELWPGDYYRSGGQEAKKEPWSDAQAVCRQLGIPFYALNCAQEFKRRVVNYFLATYASGATPNPCVVCNKQVKFRRLIRYANQIGFDAVASGHYARLIKDSGRYELWRAKDKAKDQSYFLYQLSQADLARLYFPLGNLTKNEVRDLAKDYHLPVANKKDSQEVCFINNGLSNFLKHYLPLTPGPIVDSAGHQIGEHEGLALYTIGQRRGIKVGGSGPYYVRGYDFLSNTLLVTSNIDDPQLLTNNFFISQLFWSSGRRPRRSVDCQVVIRYHHQPLDCRLTRGAQGEWRVELARPEHSVTPGQSAVFYEGDKLLGGGVIALSDSFC